MYVLNYGHQDIEIFFNKRKRKRKRKSKENYVIEL